MKRIIPLLIIIFFMGGCSFRPEGPEQFSRTEPVMGTFVQVKVISGEFSEKRMREIVDGAFSLGVELEKKLSAYMIDSEVNRLNRKRSMPVSKDLYNIVKEAKRISRLTEGEFDITVAPLMKKNGFYSDMPEELLDRIPDDPKVTGWRNATLRIDGSILLRKGVWVDLSGIAKGYIVDKMAGHILESGIRSLLINAGGDIYCTARDDDNPWHIGLRRPGANTMIMTMDIKNAAVATSGDYENVVTQGETGEVISHIIDPLSRKPIFDRGRSVTVISDDCTSADALATGMMAMGVESAVALAEKLEGVEVIYAESGSGEDIIERSSGAGKWISSR